jgi:TonB-dependent SusC/RagA subfamily outer membrane receptor
MRNGTATVSSGFYSVTAKTGDTLLFTALGKISQRIVVGADKGNVNIYMQDAENTGLEDVIVTTALGIKKEQKSLGYAVQQVSGETMEKIKEPTVASALTGKVAGLDIGNTTDFFQAPSISLRGQTPLIVIDGVPDLEGDVFKINADDIESVSVLKGTSAAALYGSIGKNGAILYTTKRGKRGKSEFFHTGSDGICTDTQSADRIRGRL